MFQDLVNIKRKLLDKHKQYDVSNPDEYREGILSGLVVALQTVDQLMESEDERMSREFGEDEKK